MKRLFIGGVTLGAWVQLAGLASAQSTIDALDEELREVKQQHDDVTTQNMANFFSQVDQAMTSPDAAVALWQQAGGPMPAPTPVTTNYSTETASERETRLAQDKANAQTLGAVLQIHCGLLHYAALFVTKPDQKGLRDEFLGWLQKTAQAYPQLGSIASSPGDAGAGQHHRRRDQGEGAPPPPPQPPFNLGSIKGKSMKDSLISKYLGFANWGDKEQAGWSVKDIPKLFKADILDPSRTPPTQATLANWDIYIAMMQADQPDNDKWTSTDFPPLQFERGCDDYALTPNVDKLEALVQIIHANPSHPQADDWLKRTRQMLDDYRAKRTGAVPAAASGTPAPASSTNGNVIVTTVQQGDAQIVTTHTNATANPAPPQ